MAIKKKLLPHEERVFDEKKNLDVKIKKLQSFIDSPNYQTKLTKDEQELIFIQVSSMKLYSLALGFRIKRF